MEREGMGKEVRSDVGRSDEGKEKVSHKGRE